MIVTEDCATGAEVLEKFPNLPDTTTADVGGTAGAVYVPLVSIVPLVASPPATPFTIHVTEPTNGDENASVCPVVSVAEDGLRLKITDEAVGDPELCPDVEVDGFTVGVPHPAQNSDAASSPMDKGLRLFSEYKLVEFLLLEELSYSFVATKQDPHPQ